MRPAMEQHKVCSFSAATILAMLLISALSMEPLAGVGVPIAATHSRLAHRCVKPCPIMFPHDDDDCTALHSRVKIELWTTCLINAQLVTTLESTILQYAELGRQLKIMIASSTLIR